MQACNFGLPSASDSSSLLKREPLVLILCLPGENGVFCNNKHVLLHLLFSFATADSFNLFFVLETGSQVDINNTRRVKMTEFKSVVFSGGGSRCFWQTGFWDIVSRGLALKPDVVAAVSAGAAMAAMVMSGTSDLGLRLLREATLANRKNFYIFNLFNKKPVCPHYTIYRNTLLRTVDDAALQRIKAGPEIRVMFAHPPGYLGAMAGTAIGLSSYIIEKYIKHPVHPRLALKLGYTATVISLNDCSSAEELVDLVMCSSCSPPFVPVHRHDGRIALDGGLIDNVPVTAIGRDEAKGDMLILMSRRHKEKRIPEIPGRVYVQPSSAPAVGKWDFTNPVALQKAYDMGRRDGETFVKQFMMKFPSYAPVNALRQMVQPVQVALG